MSYSLSRISGSKLNKGSFSGTWFNGYGVSLLDGQEKGEYISPFISSPFLFKEAIPSVNIDCQSSSSFKIHIEFENNLWHYFGYWGRSNEDEETSALLDCDYFKIEKPAKKCRFKIGLFRRADEPTPVIKSLNMAFSEEIFTNTRPFNNSIPTIAKTLPVPFRSQFSEDPAFCAHICSATSIGMVMNYYGKNIATAEIVRKVYDPFYDMYGLWWRSAQIASEYGFTSWVQYFQDWQSCEDFIAQGIPVIACTAYKEGELPGAPAEFSQGHIIVISGFDTNGNPICRDSAGKDEKTGILTYDRESFGKSWFSNAGGVGYIIHG